ncbi:TetR/AcrR family transcriptional regulator [Celeribacter indicus]|uniref:Transcriptional regulator n=1 Tax=Celeribacter indicus TaxID=1208324 RepID=A0A0B5E5P2_9RHOB|nr:TetR/AcrR family transcriptional regulator [Celeribacter indicus]AJE48690.1 transcriptional regulator [Celeribacter indicus]SDX12891.1 transcriptional regulator, TetR family [Celeribacter indicus]
MTFMKKKERRPPGRPRSFDREAALESAMRLFWRHGYDGVSYQQLMEAMQVTPPTVYAAFGNKASLYKHTLDHYYCTRVGSMSYLDAAGSLAEAADLFLHSTAKALVDPEGERGCMINVGMLASHPDNAALTQDLVERRARFQANIAQAFRRWVPTDEDAAKLARFLNTMLQGMSVQARNGATLEELNETIQYALHGLGPLDAAHSNDQLAD